MASIIVESGEQKGQAVFVETGGEMTIGRAESCDPPLTDTSASRTHCRVLSQGDAWLIEDLESTNGTRVNEKDVTRKILTEGDVIMIGKARLVFSKANRVVPPTATPEEAPPARPAAPKIDIGPVKTKPPPKLNVAPTKPPPKFDRPPPKEVKVKLVPGRGRGKNGARNGDETQPARPKRPARRRRR